MVALAPGSVHYRETEKNHRRSDLKTPQRKRPKANVCVMFSTFRSKSSHLPHCLMSKWTPHTQTQSHWSKLREKIKKEHIPYLTGVHNCLKQFRAPQHRSEVWAEVVWASNGPFLTWLQPFPWLFEPLKNCSKIWHLIQSCSWDRSFTFGHKRWKRSSLFAFLTQSGYVLLRDPPTWSYTPGLILTFVFFSFSCKRKLLIISLMDFEFRWRIGLGME